MDMNPPTARTTCHCSEDSPAVASSSPTSWTGRQHGWLVDEELPAGMDLDREPPMVETGPLNTDEEGEGLCETRVPGIEIIEIRAGVFLARFTLSMFSVSSAALTGSHARWSELGTVAQGEAARQRAFASLTCSLPASQRVRVIHTAGGPASEPARYRMHIEGAAMATSAACAEREARELLSSTRTTLTVGTPQFGFKANEKSQSDLRAWVESVELVVGAIAVRRPPSAALSSAASAAEQGMMLPIVPRSTQTYLEGVVAALSAQPTTTQLVIEWRGFQWDTSRRADMAQEATSLLEVTSRFVRMAGLIDFGGEVAPADLDATHRLLQGWLADPVGVRMRVWLRSQGPLPPTLAHLIGREVFLGRPFEARSAARGHDPQGPRTGMSLDLSAIVTRDMPMPPLFPDPASVEACGLERNFPPVEFDMPAKGIVLGDMVGHGRRLAVRLSEAALDQHCYVAGVTGTGKSRFLESIVAKAIRRGYGGMLIDPNGDLYKRVLAAFPDERKKDLVLLDFTDFSASPGINLLQFQTKTPSIERSQIVNNLTQMFQLMHPDNPEAFGPMFKMYLMIAVLLVMEEPGCTVSDIARVFTSPAYRRHLLSICKDPQVVDLWKGLASRAGGDAALENIAPYIVCKLTEMLQDELVLRVVGQAVSTIDLRECMDRSRFVLVNTSKGLLSERGSHFLTMLLTSRLFAAAMGRADLAPQYRVPFHVVWDECQNGVHKTLEVALSEGRKYGLRLVLANQNLSQLSPSLVQSVLSNCTNKLVMRVGPDDAEVLARWMAPQFTAADLMSLPNRHAVARILCDGRVSPPFAMQTRTTPEPEDTPEAEARVAALRNESKQLYCVVADVISRQLATKWSRTFGEGNSGPARPA